MSAPSSCKRTWRAGFGSWALVLNPQKERGRESRVARVVREAFVKSVKPELARKLRFWKAKEEGAFSSCISLTRGEDTGVGCVGKIRKEPGPQQ